MMKNGVFRLFTRSLTMDDRLRGEWFGILISDLYGGKQYPGESKGDKKNGKKQEKICHGSNRTGLDFGRCTLLYLNFKCEQGLRSQRKTGLGKERQRHIIGQVCKKGDIALWG
jgi:hypothetical protein